MILAFIMLGFVVTGMIWLYRIYQVAGARGVFGLKRKSVKK
jgi:hypothetical protein